MMRDPIPPTHGEHGDGPGPPRYRCPRCASIVDQRRLGYWCPTHGAIALAAFGSREQILAAAAR